MNSVSKLIKLLGGSTFAITLLICYVIAPGALTIFIVYNIANSQAELSTPLLDKVQQMGTLSTLTITGALLFGAIILVYRLVVRARRLRGLR